MDAQASRRIGLAVLALCFVLSMLGRGLIDSFGVFLLPIVADFGWDRAQVISIYSVALLSSGLSLPCYGIGNAECADSAGISDGFKPSRRGAPTSGRKIGRQCAGARLAYRAAAADIK
jgi:hypothetical protein